MSEKLNGPEFSILIGFAVGMASGFVVPDEQRPEFRAGAFPDLVTFSEIGRHLRSSAAKAAFLDLVGIQLNQQPSREGSIAKMVRMAAGLERW